MFFLVISVNPAWVNRLCSLFLLIVFCFDQCACSVVNLRASSSSSLGTVTSGSSSRGFLWASRASFRESSLSVLRNEAYMVLTSPGFNTIASKPWLLIRLAIRKLWLPASSITVSVGCSHLNKAFSPSCVVFALRRLCGPWLEIRTISIPFLPISTPTKLLTLKNPAHHFLYAFLPISTPTKLLTDSIFSIIL